MPAKKFKPFGVCSFCLRELETIDSDPQYMRHIETKELWRQCDEGRAGRNLLRELIRTNLAMPRLKVRRVHDEELSGDPGEEKQTPKPHTARSFDIFRRD